MKITCGRCGNSCKMPNDSELIYVHGPKDSSGLDHYYLYCRRCKHVTDFTPPGCLALLFLQMRHKAIGTLDPAEIYKHTRDIGHPEQFGIFAEKIQDAMRADGVIPPS